ncbi:MAG TPA: aromatic ring-hydroxylating dioxygenase subunit alpha [Stellaceae bacterium]|nr:aromatic ring-hydroxylating dioxygenase subunit alpha [Stellaceae bacterium]
MSIATLDSESRSGLVEIDRRRLRFRVDRAAYRDDEIFRRERATIFSQCWLYLGHASEIPRAGDFVTRTIGGYDIIFNRNAAGEVRAYFNACSHRGATVCRERSGSTRVFTCPYHGWVYDLEGRLRDQGAKGGYPAGFNAEGDYNLRPVPRLETYRDFCFVNFNPRAIGLVDYLADAADYLALVADQAETGMEVIPGGVSLEAAGNWKLLMENSYDAYHGPSLHSTYFEFLDQRVGGQNMAATQMGFGAGLGQGHGVFELNLRSGRPIAQWIPPFGEAAKPKIEAVKARLVEKFGQERADRMAERQRNLIIFPNLVVNDNLGISVRTVFPLSPNRMTVDIWILGPKGEDPIFRKLRLDNYLTFVGPTGFATPDDIEAFALCQRGNVHAPGGWSDISKGMSADEDLLHARADFMDEAQMRGWWMQWDRLIGGAETLEA